MYSVERRLREIQSLFVSDLRNLNVQLYNFAAKLFNSKTVQNLFIWRTCLLGVRLFILNVTACVENTPHHSVPVHACLESRTLAMRWRNNALFNRVFSLQYTSYCCLLLSIRRLNVGQFLLRDKLIIRKPLPVKTLYSAKLLPCAAVAKYHSHQQHIKIIGLSTPS